MCVCVCLHAGATLRGRREERRKAAGGGGSEFGFSWLLGLGRWGGSSEAKSSIPLPRAGRLTATLSPHTDGRALEAASETGQQPAALCADL